MKNIIHTIIGVIVAVGLLAVLWYTNNDRFDIDITKLATESGCIQSVNDSEGRVTAEFEKRALEAISGKGFGDALPKPTAIDEWKPSIESLRLLLDTDVIVDMALSRLRTNIAKDQVSDPESLLNKQKTKLSGMFETARDWCTTLPE